MSENIYETFTVGRLLDYIFDKELGPSTPIELLDLGPLTMCAISNSTGERTLLLAHAIATIEKPDGA